MAQPEEWQDCAKALDHDELKGVVMPKGGLEQVNPPGAYLQYNEVSPGLFAELYDHQLMEYGSILYTLPARFALDTCSWLTCTKYPASS